jgi:large subunit ribosomal protein L10
VALGLEDKKTIVADVSETASNALSLVVADARGVEVGDMTELRKQARENQVVLRVVKNTLAKKALEGTKFDSLSEVLTGPTLLAFSLEDYQSAAKLIKSFSAIEESFEVKGLSIGEGFLEANELNNLASLPSKEEAISMLLGLLNAPVQKLAGTLNEVPTSFVRTLSAVGSSKS